MFVEREKGKERRQFISALQADSEARIANYRKLFTEAEKPGERARWKKLFEEERKILEMIIRVERINSQEILEKKGVVFA